MIRVFQIAVLLSLAFVLTGCNGPDEVPIWEQVKITDLASPHSGEMADLKPLKTVNFNVHIFEIPAENASTLDDVWQMVDTKPFRFSDYDAFGGNWFSIGFGQIQMWDKIRDLLHAGGGKKSEAVLLLLSNSQSNDLVIARLDTKQTISYALTESSAEAVTLGRGTIALRIKAEKIPGLRSTYRISALPVFSPPTSSPISELVAHGKSGEFLFVPLGFKVQMRPGTFLLLGPKKYISDQLTLNGLFFSRLRRTLTAGHIPVVRIYLIVFTGISH